MLPVFAIANAGVHVDNAAFSQTFHSSLAMGIVLGLAIGKPVGIASFTWIACRTGLCRFPTNATWRQMFGVAAVAGMGFTVSLVIANVAFSDSEAIALSKIGILIAAILAAVIGGSILLLFPNDRSSEIDLRKEHPSAGRAHARRMS